MVLDREAGEILRGSAARTVDNMEASLGVPTATSVRAIPAKLLEENRRIINRYLRARGAKVSFTHLIGWAVLKALAAPWRKPRMRMACPRQRSPRSSRSARPMAICKDMRLYFPP